MNKNLYRFAGAFVVVLGLAYLGHNLFVRAPVAAPAPAHEAAPAAAAPAAAPAAPAAPTANAYAVYPDKETDSALGLTYPSFSGDFVHDVTITPLPPGAAGRTTLRIKGQGAATLSVALTDTRCASPVHVVVSRIDDKKPIEVHELTAASPKFAAQFDKQWMPHLLVEARMDDKAQDNYYCGLAVHWGA